MWTAKEPKPQYTQRIKTMTNEQLVAEVEKACWFSAFSANNPRCEFHEKTDLLYDEAVRRHGNYAPCYEKGFRKAARSEGHDLGDPDAINIPEHTGIHAEIRSKSA